MIEVGSPCEPVHMITTSLSGMFSAWSMLTIRLSGNVQVTQLARHLHVIDHAGADEGHLAPVALGDVGHLLHARDERGKAGDDDASFGFAEDLVKGAVDDALGGRPAGALGVGRIGQQCQHAALRELGQLGVIRSASCPPACGRTCNRLSARSAQPAW